MFLPVCASIFQENESSVLDAVSSQPRVAALKGNPRRCNQRNIGDLMSADEPYMILTIFIELVMILRFYL